MFVYNIIVVPAETINWVVDGPGEVNEGGEIRIKLSAINLVLPNLPLRVPYTVTGVSQGDINSLAGEFVLTKDESTSGIVITDILGVGEGDVLDVGAMVNIGLTERKTSGVESASGTIVLNVTEDHFTEGLETAVITIGDLHVRAIRIRDTSVTISYLLTADVSSVVEGASVVITLTTTGLPVGTVVPWSLSGVDTADLDVSSGQFVLGNDGVATATLKVLKDYLLEDDTIAVLSLDQREENVTFTVVNGPAPIKSWYLKAVNQLGDEVTEINEGSLLTFVVGFTAEVLPVLPYSVVYSISGVEKDDIGVELVGTLDLVRLTDGEARVTQSVIVAADLTDGEGDQTLVYTVGQQSVTVIVRDTSRIPVYTLGRSALDTEEGQSVVVTLVTDAVPVGTVLGWRITGAGVTAADFGLTELVGEFVVGSAETLTMNVVRDYDPVEGTEHAVFALTNGKAAILLNLVDNQAPVVTYQVKFVDVGGAEIVSANEGDVIGVHVTATAVRLPSVPISMPYTISGVESSDISQAPLSGVLSLTGDITKVEQVKLLVLAADLSIGEGSERLVFDIGGLASATLTIVDTSREPVYVLSAASSVSEGQSVVVTLVTDAVADGTVVPYTITGGISPSDIGSSGIFVVQSGTASITIPVVRDYLIESDEILIVTLNNGKSTVTVNVVDGPTPIITYDISFVDGAGNVVSSMIEGQSVIVKVVATSDQLPVGTFTRPYLLTGVTTDDIVGGVISGAMSFSGNTTTAAGTLTVTLASDLTTEGTEVLGITVDGTVSSVTVTVFDTSITPVVTVGADPTSAPDPVTSMGFGWSIDIDGTNSAVGAYMDNVDTGSGLKGSAGSVYVYDTSSGTPMLLQKLTDPTGAVVNERFGSVVAMSGNTLVIGALGTGLMGKVWVFVQSGGAWIPEQQITVASGSYFGYRVAISGDTIAVTYDYKVGMWTRAGGVWTQQQTLTFPNYISNIAIDGDTFVSSYVSGSYATTFYVYVRSNNTWTLEQSFVDTHRNQSDTNYPGNIQFALEGNTIVAGSWMDDTYVGGIGYSGSATIYTRVAGSWTETALLTPSDPMSGGYFGISTAISGDSIVIGARAAKAGTVNGAGAAYVFKLISGTWRETTKLIASDPTASDFFGIKVAASGNYQLIGAYGNDVALSNTGSIYLYNI